MISEIITAPGPAPETPVKEPNTKPTEKPGNPSTSPGKDDDPWSVPSPSVEPTPKA